MTKRAGLQQQFRLSLYMSLLQLSRYYDSFLGFVGLDSFLSSVDETKRYNKLIVLSLHLEVGLGMVADGALLGGLLANHDMAAVGALPDDIVVL